MISDVLTHIQVVEFLAKDLHYRASGIQFYSLHLLADKIDFGTLVDDLKEAYYLSNDCLPPRTSSIALHACNIISGDEDVRDYNILLSRLTYALTTLIESIQELKSDGEIHSGVFSVLDAISQKALVFNGLIKATVRE